MTELRKVLGIDLACKDWADNGAAILTFEPGPNARWIQVEYGCVEWPKVPLTAVEMARVIEQEVLSRGICAVSLDGPQGWREPMAAPRNGVGRVCEYEARCQGKTGEYGRCYPQTQFRWIQFCIDVFSELLRRKNAQIVNNRNATESLLQLPEGSKYWLLECFPTSTWRKSNLKPLPGKSRCGKKRTIILQYSNELRERYALPELLGADRDRGSHDDLQAIVASLPAAGLLGGPCTAKPHGKPGWTTKAEPQNIDVWVEGLIWDATVAAEQLRREIPTLSIESSETSAFASTDANNPILVDDRDDLGDSILNRGVRLFRWLADKANSKQPVGIGYAQFVCYVHGVSEFSTVAGRQYLQSDTAYVLSLADQITVENGGPIPVTADGNAINCGMDAFICGKMPPYPRPAKAFECADYSAAQWEAVFPTGVRRLATSVDVLSVLSESIDEMGNIPNACHETGLS